LGTPLIWFWEPELDGNIAILKQVRVIATGHGVMPYSQLFLKFLCLRGRSSSPSPYCIKDAHKSSPTHLLESPGTNRSVLLQVNKPSGKKEG